MKKRLKIGIQAGSKSKAPKITRAIAPDIASQLSKAEQAIIKNCFIAKVGIKNVNLKAVESLCSKGILRKDKDLLSKKNIFVLERGGRLVCDVIRRQIEGKSPKKGTPKRVRVEIDRHDYEGQQDRCLRCKKPPEHKVHVQAGHFLCAGLSNDPIRVCFNEVDRKDELCGECKENLKRWEKAYAVQQGAECPNCGCPKRMGFSVDQKCYHELPDALKHGLFKQHSEPVNAFRVRYPLALKSALDHLRHKPTLAEIREKAKAM